MPARAVSSDHGDRMTPTEALGGPRDQVPLYPRGGRKPGRVVADGETGLR